MNQDYVQIRKESFQAISVYCVIRQNWQIMEGMIDFKYISSLILCMHENMDGEIQGRALQGRKVVGSSVY